MNERDSQDTLLATYRALLIALASKEPIDDPDEYGDRSCVYCGAWRVEGGLNGTVDRSPHAADCPWRQAVQTLGLPIPPLPD